MRVLRRGSDRQKRCRSRRPCIIPFMRQLFRAHVKPRDGEGKASRRVQLKMIFSQIQIFDAIPADPIDDIRATHSFFRSSSEPRRVDTNPLTTDALSPLSGNRRGLRLCHRGGLGLTPPGYEPPPPGGFNQAPRRHDPKTFWCNKTGNTTAMARRRPEQGQRFTNPGRVARRANRDLGENHEPRREPCHSGEIRFAGGSQASGPFFNWARSSA